MEIKIVRIEAFIQREDHDHPISIVVYSSWYDASLSFYEVGQVEVINKPCQEGRFKQLLNDVIKKFRFLIL